MKQALKQSTKLTALVLFVLSSTHHECEAVPVRVSQYYSFHVSQSFLFQLFSYREHYLSESPYEDFTDTNSNDSPEDVDAIDVDETPEDVEVISIGPIDLGIYGEFMEQQLADQNGNVDGMPFSEETQLNQPDVGVSSYEALDINQSDDLNRGSGGSVWEYFDPDSSEKSEGYAEETSSKGSEANLRGNPSKDSDTVSRDSNEASKGDSEENLWEILDPDSDGKSEGKVDEASSKGSEGNVGDDPIEDSDTVSGDSNGATPEENLLDYFDPDSGGKSEVKVDEAANKGSEANLWEDLIEDSDTVSGDSNGASCQTPEENLWEYSDPDSGEKSEGNTHSDLFEATSLQPDANLKDESGENLQEDRNNAKADSVGDLIDEPTQNQYNFWADQVDQAPNEMLEENTGVGSSGNVGETRQNLGGDLGVNMDEDFADPVQVFNVPYDDVVPDTVKNRTHQGVENGTINSFDDAIDKKLTEVLENGASKDTSKNIVKNIEINKANNDSNNDASKHLTEASENGTIVDAGTNPIENQENGTDTEIENDAGINLIEGPENKANNVTANDPSNFIHDKQAARL